MGKLPGFIFYPGDWMKDPELRSVSSEARGLWIDMLCLMFEAQPRGYLTLRGGRSVTAALLARMTGNLELKIIQWIEELEVRGVLSRDEQGIIYCRRMVKDQQVREQTNKRVQKFRSRYTSVTSAFPVNENETVNEDQVLKKEKENGNSPFNPTEVAVSLAREYGIIGMEEISLLKDSLTFQKGDPMDNAKLVLDAWLTHKDSGAFPQQFKAFIKQGHWKPKPKPKRKYLTDDDDIKAGATA